MRPPTVVASLVVLFAGVASAQSLSVSTVSAPIGAAAFVSVRLDNAEGRVVAMQADLLFPPELEVASRGDSIPACVVNPALDRGDSAFAFREGNRVRGIVVTFGPGIRTVLPDGVWLFGCTVRVRADRAGEYVIGCANAIGSSSLNAVPPSERIDLPCAPGVVIVADAQCRGDENGDGQVWVDEVVGAVSSLLDGCAVMP